MNLIFVSLFVLAICIPHSHAQELYFEKVISRDGEANLSVRQIIQDKNGFLWLATFNGLYRYEGDEYIIRHQFHNNAEINSDVTCLVQDLEYNLWIGTDNGLSKYNLDTEVLHTYYHDPDDSSSISDKKIRSIDIDREGRIWIGTRGGGLNIYTPENESFVSVKFDKSEGAEFLAKNEDFYHDSALLPIHLYVDLLTFETSLHEMSRLKKMIEESGELLHLEDIEKTLAKARKELEIIHQRNIDGDKNERWKGWYDPAKRRHNNGFPSLARLDAIEANFKSRY